MRGHPILKEITEFISSQESFFLHVVTHIYICVLSKWYNLVIRFGNGIEQKKGTHSQSSNAQSNRYQIFNFQD